MGGHGLDAHDVGDLAHEPGIVVVGLGHEGQNVLGYLALGRVDRLDLLAVPVPDHLSRGIAAPGFAGEVDRLSPSQGLALHVALDGRRPGRICSSL